MRQSSLSRVSGAGPFILAMAIGALSATLARADGPYRRLVQIQGDLDAQISADIAHASLS